MLAICNSSSELQERRQHCKNHSSIDEVGVSDAVANGQVLVKDRFALSSWQLFMALMWREMVLLDRNLFLYVFRFIQLILVGVITGTLYLRTRLHPNNIADGSLYEAAIFYSLIGLMFDGFVEMNLTVGAESSWSASDSTMGWVLMSVAWDPPR